MKHISLAIFVAIVLSSAGHLRAQQSISALFIGNSYTEVNNLPQMTADIAASRGRTLEWRSNTPGGCTFMQHCTNQSMALIGSGGWDIVVLQEQSQYPSFPQQQVEAEVFPYATQLVEAIYAASPCAEPMFYMTWGRRDGDERNAQYFPVLGTYEGMDSMLYERYMYMAESNDASVCPVGRVWRHLRRNNPEIELYQSDGSHPSVAGTYAAACAFYVMFFNESPDSIAYAPSGLDVQTAQSIRLAVNEVVWLQADQWRRPKPEAVLHVGEAMDVEVALMQHSTHADSVVWNFGDGTTLATAAGDSMVVHRYADAGSYEVALVASRHCMTDTARATVTVSDTAPEGISMPWASDGRLTVSPNPTASMPTICLDGSPIDSASARITLIGHDGRKYPYSLLENNQLPSGVYLLRVDTLGITYHARLVIMR